jgi:DNA-binding transcriptional LysR family regulator
VNLFDMSATEQAKALIAGKIQAGFIGFAHEADAANLEKMQVGVCRFVAALPTHHPLARRRELKLDHLAQEFFAIVSEESYPGARQIILQACQSSGFRPRILQNAARGFTVLGLVAGGCAVALLPETLTALPHTGVSFRKIEPAPSAAVYLAWKNGAAPTLLTMLRNAVAADATGSGARS